MILTLYLHLAQLWSFGLTTVSDTNFAIENRRYISIFLCLKYLTEAIESCAHDHYRNLFETGAVSEDNPKWVSFK